MTRLVAAVVAGMLAGPLTAPAQDPVVSIVPGTCLSIVPGGAPSGGDAIYCNEGTFLGLRDLQGGGPGNTNFDIGAGSTQNPGDLVLNYDVGRCTSIDDGHKHKVAMFCPSGITFYKRPKVKAQR